MLKFISGVMTSIATAAVLWTLRRSVASTVACFTRGSTRRLQGDWHTVFVKDGHLHEEEVEAYQLGPFIWGVIRYRKKKRKYTFSGTVRHGVLVAKYETAGDGSVVDRGSFTLSGQPVGELSYLRGAYAWTDDDTQSPKADDYFWVREGETKVRERIEAKDSPIEGLGVFARASFPEGQVLGYFEGDPVLKASKYSVTFDGQRIEPCAVLRHLNHSCSPSARFRRRWLVSTTQIKEGEEITIDYLQTEEDLEHGFDCLCGAKQCRGHIGK